jgi:hypothetical protein
MEDKRTRSDYIREIDKLERKVEDIISLIEDEIFDIDRRIELINEKMDTDGGYTMRMYLTQQKNVLLKVSKKIDELN